MATRKSPKKKAEPRGDTRDLGPRILRVFSDRAKRSGTRAVVMAELAAELRVSMSTLYAHYPSKDDLVAAMVDHWCEDLATHDALIEGDAVPIRERIAIWGEAWSARVVEYTPAFWRDLKRDHPVLWTRLQQDLARRKAKGASLLRPHLKPGLTPAAAFALLELIYTHAHDPRLSDEIGVARRDVIRTALAIWADGALVAE
jgi:AcrR family transcriptional regulator